MCHKMNLPTDRFYFSISLSFCIVLVAANYTTAGYGEEFVEDETVQSASENTTKSVSEEIDSSDEDLSLTLKMATLCQTPNNDPGFCIEIKECDLLLKQLNNTDARQFLRASQCGPPNENPKNPKVCCGKFDNYRKVSKDIVNDGNILPKSCGVQKMILRGRIVGGKEATLGEYPWMARLIHKNKFGYKSFGCSGFLVHVKYVVTAGHCTHPDLIQIRGQVFSVTLGEHNTETMVDCSPGGTFCAEPRQISRVEKVIVHPDYDPNSTGHYNDIAIIHMKKGAHLTEYVKPICLPAEVNEIPTIYYLSGWGKTETSASSKIKMKVELQPFDKGECKEKYSLLGIEIRDTQICAGGQEKKDSCTGDSGGPLMVSSSNGSFYASGIVSYGIGCGRIGWPGVYTDVSKYVPWIKKQILLNSMLSARSNKGKRRHKKNKAQKTN